jgi:hypothetical protein
MVRTVICSFNSNHEVVARKIFPLLKVYKQQAGGEGISVILYIRVEIGIIGPLQAFGMHPFSIHLKAYYPYVLN